MITLTCCKCIKNIPCWNDEDDDGDIGPGTQMLIGYYHCPYDNHVHSGKEICIHQTECQKIIISEVQRYEATINSLKQCLRN